MIGAAGTPGLGSAGLGSTAVSAAGPSTSPGSAGTADLLSSGSAGAPGASTEDGRSGAVTGLGPEEQATARKEPSSTNTSRDCSLSMTRR